MRLVIQDAVTPSTAFHPTMTTKSLIRSQHKVHPEVTKVKGQVCIFADLTFDLSQRSGNLFPKHNSSVR